MLMNNNFNPQCITYSQMNLIVNARIYYRRLMAWTRAYFLSKYFGIGAAEDLFSRLYSETLDLGNMLKIIHGSEDAEQYSRILSLFAIALREIIDAQLAGNMEEVTRNVNRLYEVAAERKAFIQKINPYASPEYESLFEIYVQYILEEANALAAGDYSRDIAVYDLLTAHVDRMGDAFAEGIYDFITSGSADTESLEPSDDGECITYEQMNDIFTIRMLWFELVTWVRNYMLSRYVGIGNSDEIYARLKEVPVEYVNTLKKYFDDIVVEDYIQLFDTYIELIDAFITANMEGDVDELNEITKKLYQNADERAAFDASINPFWDEIEGRNRLYTNLRTTIDESTTFLTGDYARNIDIFARLLDQAENASTFLGQGLSNYIISNQQIQGFRS